MDQITVYVKFPKYDSCHYQVRKPYSQEIHTEVLGERAGCLPLIKINNIENEVNVAKLEHC